MSLLRWIWYVLRLAVSDPWLVDEHLSPEVLAIVGRTKRRIWPL